LRQYYSSRDQSYIGSAFRREAEPKQIQPTKN